MTAQQIGFPRRGSAVGRFLDDLEPRRAHSSRGVELEVLVEVRLVLEGDPVHDIADGVVLCS